MTLCPSIKRNLLVVAVGCNIDVSGTSILGLPNLFGKGVAFLDDFLLLLQVLLGHLVQVEAVDLGVMGRCALLEGVDGRGIEPVLDEAKGGAPEWVNAYSSVW
jgi:hypothetical protein